MSTPETIAVAPQDLDEDRYSRLRLIPWWDQKKIAATRVLVIGAGALGNEILKNLALLGFRQIVIADLDRIEESNLSRSVLFRTSDIGQFKADVAARGVNAILPEATVRPLVANVVHGCGLGLIGWSDIILAGLDNREARLWINRSAWKMNRPWIDGAIEGVNGIARLFLPNSPPCYECTLGETDWKLLEQRMSCNLLAREANTEGKVPTTPTISSIIAGIEVQEAVKLIHGLPTLASRAYVFEGVNHTSYVVDYTENPECMSHYVLENIIPLTERSSDLTLNQLLQRARQDLGSSDVVLEFSREVIHKLVCSQCGAEEEVMAPLGTINREQGRCAKDSEVRTVVTAHGFSGEGPLGDRTLDKLGLPLFDVFTARSSDRECAYLLAGDKPAVLGPDAPGVGN
jgi:molybdopterin/thiamine biosynthesis adenylyltransferase